MVRFLIRQMHAALWLPAFLGYLRFGSLWGDTSFMLVLLEVRSWSRNYSTLVSVKDEFSSCLGGELLN